MPVEDENLAETEVRKVAQHVREVHGHHFRPNRNGSAKMRRVRRTLRKSDGGKQQPSRPRGHTFRNSRNDDGIRSKRIMRTMELQAAEGQNRQAIAGYNVRHLESDDILEPFWL